MRKSLLLIAFFTCLSLYGGSCQADLVLTVTGDGNTGSTWTLSGSGVSAQDSDFNIFAFSEPQFPDAFVSANPAGAGSMQIAGIPIRNAYSGIETDFEIATGSVLPAGTDLSTATGSFVAVNDVFGRSGLPANTTIVSANSFAWGKLTITNVVVAQVNGSGPSDSSLFDTVINVPTDPNVGNEDSIGGDGLTTQLNVSASGTVGTFFDAESGGEVNISGGSIGDFLDARSGSELNISGGSIGDGFRAFSNSFVNISGGSVGDAFLAFNGSEINLFGSDFVLDGVSLDDSSTIDDAFTILDRDVILSGLLDDGSAFSFELNSVFQPNTDADFFHPNARLTVTLVSTDSIILGDCDLNGVVTFLDINPFIAVLSSNSFLAQADCNQDGVVDFLDIGPFIAILAGN